MFNSHISTKVLCPLFDEIRILIPGNSPSIFPSHDLWAKYEFLIHYRNEEKPEGHSIERIYLRQRSSDGSVDKKYVLSNSESVQCNFFIFDHVTFIQFKFAAVYKISSKSDDFFHWDIAIYRFSKWRPSAILELFYHHTRPSTKSPLLAAAACQISCQSDRYTDLKI